MSYKIGIDISGGDYAPDEIFKERFGQKEYGEDIVLIGVKRNKNEARKLVNLNDFTVIHAPEKSKWESLRRRQCAVKILDYNRH